MANSKEEADTALKGAKQALREFGRGLMTSNQLRGFMGLKPRCKACSESIEIQIFQGEAWCSDDCRKIIQGEVVPE